MAVLNKKAMCNDMHCETEKTPKNSTRTLLTVPKKDIDIHRYLYERVYGMSHDSRPYVFVWVYRKDGKDTVLPENLGFVIMEYVDAQVVVKNLQRELEHQVIGPLYYYPTTKPNGEFKCFVPHYDGPVTHNFLSKVMDALEATDGSVTKVELLEDAWLISGNMTMPNLTEEEHVKEDVVFH